MFRSALKSAQVNAPRFRLTVLAVILSVAFLTATLVLTASMTGTADDDIASAHWGVDAVVEGRILVEGEGWAGEAAVDTRRALPSDAFAVVSNTDGVAATAKVIRGFAKLVDDGLALGDSSALDVGRNWITDRNLNPFEITAGVAPTGPGRGRNRPRTREGRRARGRRTDPGADQHWAARRHHHRARDLRWGRRRTHEAHNAVRRVGHG